MTKKKITKEVKLTILYREYEGGMRMIKYTPKKSKEIERWIADNYVRELFAKDRS